jgi:hypothetical protein
LPQTQHILDSLTDDEERHSEERARYRSWRKGNAEFPYSNAVSQHLKERSHVDKKIEATLPKAEQPTTARSRKASHYLRVFKENDVAEEKKRRDGRAKERRTTEKVQHTLQDDTRPGRGYPISRPPSAIHSPQKASTESYFETVSTPASEGDKELLAGDLDSLTSSTDMAFKHVFPLQLLEDIRSNKRPALHDNRADSSVPTRAAERRQMSGQISDPATRSDYFQAGEDERQDHSPASDDDESEKEQISSALYFPHRQLQSPLQTPGEDKRRKTEAERIRKGTSLGAGKLSKGWSAVDTVKTPEEVEISLQSQDTNQCLHGDMPPTAPLPQEDDKSLTSSPEVTTSAGSDYDSVIDSSYSIAGDESSATDDLGTTPTATPRIKEPRPALGTQPPAPLGAVELKPYDHQVGGHTTVYRFSRRAVCKQLNNRENEFYETVERHHPELLEFLPRYGLFLSFVWWS